MHTFPVSADQEIINRLKASIGAGKHWYTSMLEAVRDFPHNDYLVAGEALDWIRLVRQLLDAVSGMIPLPELNRFSSQGEPPLRLDVQEAKQLLGSEKYGMYLNYLYGVTVEAALADAVTAEVIKEGFTTGLKKPKNAPGEAYLRIYGADLTVLKQAFISEVADLPEGSISAPGAEFTYWLFRYRLKHSDKEKVASDTRKALDWLKRKGSYFPRLV